MEMTRYIISDLHIGHGNIGNFRKMEDTSGNRISSEDQWELAFEGIERLRKRDTLFLLGDIVLDKKYLDRLKNVQCGNKILLMGNHDCYEGRGVTISDLADTYQKVMSLHKYKKHWLSHAPIHPSELRGLKNIHGHTHPQLMLDSEDNVDSRYVNVCVEYTGYSPITWEYAVSDEYHQECIRRYWKINNKEESIDE